MKLKIEVVDGNHEPLLDSEYSDRELVMLSALRDVVRADADESRATAIRAAKELVELFEADIAELEAEINHAYDSAYS
jgi:predicted PilT family ATPase